MKKKKIFNKIFVLVSVSILTILGIINLSLTVKMSKTLFYNALLIFCLLCINYIFKKFLIFFSNKNLLEKSRLYLFDNSDISNE